MCDYEGLRDRVEQIESGLKDLGLHRCEKCDSWKKVLKSATVIDYSDNESEMHLCQECYEREKKYGHINTHN